MNKTYTPPKIWTMDSNNGGQWSAINRPDSGARFEKVLPQGKHPFQLYSMGTPNGQKVTIMFEELLALGLQQAEYDAHLIKIGEGDQFGSGFVDLNPNSKIPALVDNSTKDPIRIFESGNILFYLAEKFGKFLPSEGKARVEVMNWLFWLQGAAPYLGGGFGHFYAYAPEKFEYSINRFSMEAKRQLDVLDKRLAVSPYLAGKEYSIADIAAWPWYGSLALGRLYDAAEFLNVASYQHVIDWAQRIDERAGVKRGKIVNRLRGEEWEQLAERHSSKDIDAVLAKKP